MSSKTHTQGQPPVNQGRAFGVTAINRVADRIDLAIDLLTLGQYGLECREVPAGTNGCEGSKGRTRHGVPHRLGGPSYIAPARL